MSNLPEPHATNAMCAELDGWTEVYLHPSPEVLLGVPPGEQGLEPVPNYREDARACASLLPKLLPRLKKWLEDNAGNVADDVEYYRHNWWEELARALLYDNRPAFCQRIIEAVRKVSEEGR